MKTNYSQLNTALTCLLVLFLFTACASKKNLVTESSEFFVTAQTEADNKITLICNAGCAWKTLSYTASNENAIQAIDEYGMADLKAINKKKNVNLSNFLFTIQKEGNRFVLKGLEGTAWKELSFSTTLYRPQGIDKMGMASN